jgi:hypothetical protein
MLLLDSIEKEKWYKVREVAKIVGWSHDRIEDWIDEGALQAFVKDLRSEKRNRIYRGKRVQGCEIIRFIKAHLTPLNPNAKVRLHLA